MSTCEDWQDGHGLFPCRQLKVVTGSSILLCLVLIYTAFIVICDFVSFCLAFMYMFCTGHLHCTFSYTGFVLLRQRIPLTDIWEGLLLLSAVRDLHKPWISS